MDAKRRGRKKRSRRRNVASMVEQYVREEDERLQTPSEPARITDASAEELQRDNKSTGDEFLALALIGKNIKLVSVTPDGNYRYIDETQKLHNILYITSSETVVLKAAVDELEWLMNDASAKEQNFQEFFERNPDFVLNDEYRRAHPHIVLSKDDGQELVPDFVLEPIHRNSLSDLLELKLPSAQVYVLKKNRMRFSASVMEACAQLREYGKYFDEEKHRTRIQEKYGLLAYKPKMFLIIGRRGNVNPITARGVQNDFQGLTFSTYDEVIARMKWRLDRMKRGTFGK